MIVNVVISGLVGAGVAEAYWLEGETGAVLSACGAWAAVEVARLMKWI